MGPGHFLIFVGFISNCVVSVGAIHDIGLSEKQIGASSIISSDMAATSSRWRSSRINRIVFSGSFQSYLHRSLHICVWGSIWGKISESNRKYLHKLVKMLKTLQWTLEANFLPRLKTRGSWGLSCGSPSGSSGLPLSSSTSTSCQPSTGLSTTILSAFFMTGTPPIWSTTKQLQRDLTGKAASL